MDPDPDPGGQKWIWLVIFFKSEWVRPVFIFPHFGRGENGKNGGSAPAAVNGSDHEEEEDDRCD
jgi:hypothetical protein